MKKTLYITLLLLMIFFGKSVYADTLNLKNFNTTELNNNFQPEFFISHLNVDVKELDTNSFLLPNDYSKTFEHISFKYDYRSVIDPEDELLYYVVNYNVFSDYAAPLPIGYFNDKGFVMSPFFLPLVFDNVGNDYDLKVSKTNFNNSPLFLQSPDFNSFKVSMDAERYIRALANEVLIEEEMNNIDKIKYDSNKLEKYEKLVHHLNTEEPTFWNRIKVRSTLSNINDSVFISPSKYNPWSKLGVAKIHFSQTHLSENWSKGGESNTAGWSQINYTLNYNDLKYIKFENNFDMKLGINSTDKDTLRDININTNQVRITSKLNVKLHKDWYYTLSADFLTQILNNYKTNTNTLKASFLSPAKLFVGLGSSYKKKTKKYNLSLDLAPLTAKFNYVEDIKNIDETSYGIKEGKHFGYELGAKISTDFTWKLTDEISYKTKFYYFSDFSYADADWENTLSYDLFGIISMQLYFDTRLDDRVKREESESDIEFHEMLSFGLSYYW